MVKASKPCWNEVTGHFADEERRANVRASLVAANTPSNLAQQGRTSTKETRSGMLVWVWGSGFQGQLGSKQKICSIPRQLCLPPQCAVCQVSCGARHTVALTDEGKVLSWGDGSGGQLGYAMDGFQIQSVPCAVELAAGVQITNIDCGDKHTVALSYQGDIWAWGSNHKGQLGRGKAKRSGLPRRVGGLLANAEIKQISCGSYHTAAITSHGKLYTWGAGDQGQLGHGSAGCQYFPTPVATFNGIAAKQVVCGSAITGAIAAANELYMWGMVDGLTSGTRPAGMLHSDYCPLPAPGTTTDKLFWQFA